MSGGYFDYEQYKIDQIADQVGLLIRNNGKKEKGEWYPDFDEVTIDKFKEAAFILRKAAIMAQRIDWLVSGDDGEETFHTRWEEDLSKLLENNE